jgi:hypothetical protein
MAELVEKPIITKIMDKIFEWSELSKARLMKNRDLK